MSRIEEIKARLGAVPHPDKPWRYNPEHEMFIGTTNALEMYDAVLDFGRVEQTWIRNDDGKGYSLSESSRQRTAQLKALGEFFESCREDIAYLLEKLEEKPC